MVKVDGAASESQFTVHVVDDDQSSARRCPDCLDR